jgi:serine/threonine-protein kinase SRPK3
MVCPLVDLLPIHILMSYPGKLRHIQHLRFWNLKNVMTDKYDFEDHAAAALQSFLEPMLSLEPQDRATAGDMSRHPWLELD